MSTVCILCSQHVPDDVRVTHRLGRRFREEGHEVTWVGPQRSRSGSDYGIRFVFFPPGTGRLGRLAHAARLLRTANALPPQDVYFAVEPDSAAVAVRLARRHGGRAVFDIHEIYHEEMLLRWVPSAFRTLAGQLVRRRISATCRQCDLVVGVGQTRLDPYAGAGVPRMVVRHCVPGALVPGPVPGPFSEAGRSLTIIHGKATMNHGTREVLQAVAILRNTDAIPCKVVLFSTRSDTAGFALTDVGRLADELGIADAIDLRAPVPYADMFPLMQSCDVGVIAYGRTFGRKCMPNRVFEYMAAGVPVVVPAYAEELIPILRRFQCGIQCDTEDAKDMANAFARLWREKDSARQMGANGRLAFERELNWERESQPLMEWIRTDSRCAHSAPSGGTRAR